MSDPEGPGDPEQPGTPEPAEAAEGPGVPAGPGTSDTTLVFTSVPTESDYPDGERAVDLSAVDALPAGSALLVVERGPVAGARFLLDADRTTAGRRPESDIFLDDVTVSRKHAEFVRREGQFLVRDVGSLNGTYVARQRIEGEVVLQAGDEVQIGKYRLLYFPAAPAGGGA
jgi:FHA domain